MADAEDGGQRNPDVSELLNHPVQGTSADMLKLGDRSSVALPKTERIDW
jgi:hypothetical protein